MHHLHYPEIPGTEIDDDLILLCRSCHDIVHNSIDGSHAWRKANRRVASWAILKEIGAVNDHLKVVHLSTSKIGTVFNER